MAKIPMGDFGNAVARPAPPVQPSFADPLGHAAQQGLQQMGATVNGILDQKQREEDAAALEQRKEAEQAREAALRAQQITALTQGKDQLADLHDEVTQGVLDGTVPKDKAETQFAERAKKLIADTGSDLPPDRRQILVAELGGDTMRLGNNVRRAVTQRDRQDVSSGITQTLEYLQRDYSRDPASATQRAEQVVDMLGPHSTFSPQELTKLKQGWKENTQRVAGETMLMNGRRDLHLLDEAEHAIKDGLPDLDPGAKNTLLAKAGAYRDSILQHQELAAQRAARENETRLHRAEAAFNTFQAMTDKGGEIAPSAVDGALQATAGTPYQAGIRSLAQSARDTGGLAAQPLNRQQGALDQLNAYIAQHGRTPELDKRKEQVEKVVRGSQADFDRDPLRAGLERGVIRDLRPIDPAGGLPGLVTQLRDRVPVAQQVSTWANGKPVSPLTADEAGTLYHQLKGLPSEERANIIATLSTVMPNGQALALAKQMEPHDKVMSYAMSVGSDQTSYGKPAARLVFLGQQWLRDHGQKDDQAPGKVLALAAQEVGDSLPGEVRQQVIETAALMHLGKQADGQNASMKESVKLALGGDLIDHNGRRLPVTTGMTPDRFRDRLSSITPKELEKQAPGGNVFSLGEKPETAAEFLADLPNAELLPAGRGRYFVRRGAGVALNAQGQKIVIEVH